MTPVKKRARSRSRPRRPVAPPADRIAAIIAGLETRYPAATIALEFGNPLELLVATILSAQCTDVRVNTVTRELFPKYRTAEDYATANPETFQEEIRSTGFFRNKTKSIIGMAQALMERHGGEVPRTMEELVRLPGVGRKTANVLLGNAFGIDDGVVVDTHVTRIANLLGLTKHQDPEKIERDLMALVPRDKWTQFAHLLIHHGRQICIARRPQCDVCPIVTLCPSADV